MTISPSESWIWQNRHCRSIRNGRNSQEPVWLCRNQVRKWVNRSKNQFLASGGSLGWTRNILWNILSARLRLRCARLEARLDIGLHGSNMARVDGTRLQPLGASLRLGYSYSTFRRRVWATSVSDEDDSYVSEFVWMISTRWNDQNLFLTTLKIRISPKTLLFSDERGSDTNCWWEKPLVVALKHSEGIKHKVLFQEQKLTNTKSLQYTPSLFLSSVSL